MLSLKIVLFLLVLGVASWFALANQFKHEKVKEPERPIPFPDSKLIELLEEKFPNFVFKNAGKAFEERCCGDRLRVFRPLYKTSGLKESDHEYTGCRWCGRVTKNVYKSVWIMND